MAEETKIMLVDDELSFLEIMTRFFQRRKIGFETADSCMEALDALGTGRFDVVIMDVSMPGVDGLRCMAEMKKIQPQLEFIILTGHASPELGISGLKSGAFDYCLKPVDFDELLEIIVLARKKVSEGWST